MSSQPYYLHNHVPHICGFYYIVPITQERVYLPQVQLKAHATVHSSIARTTLTQTFVNPSKNDKIDELRYTFPLYDGVSVVGFTCTIGGRVIKGIVKERTQARATYEKAAKEGKTAGLLEQLPKASDVFTTTVSNVPANGTLVVDITYLGELKHDAEVDGIRYTIPTSIAPRYGDYCTALPNTVNTMGSGMEILVDVDMPNGCPIKTLQSPSHPISVRVGTTSKDPDDGDLSLQKGQVTLSLGKAELSSDFIVQIIAQNTGNPTAILEEHPTLPGHRALMATLVPRFNLPYSHPEIVFICDRSGSMGSGNRIPNVKSALRVFLKSLPVGVKFNICSFGSRYSFLWDRSRSYDKDSLEEAMGHVDTFSSNFGGTEMKQPLEETFKKRYKDMNLEAFLLTDGEIWRQDELFAMLNDQIEASKGAIRVFTLGIGNDVSHALIEGVARAGQGFSQAVTDNEKLDGKVVRMLKAALTPHVNDYSLEVKYGPAEPAQEEEDDFEIIEKVQDALVIRSKEPEKKAAAVQKPISLFDTSANLDAPIDNDNADKYASLPVIDEPKMLQTPYNIPPLFPFSRTSVYILMSDAAPSGTPKSVVLRGTCEHGPLELEIPITILAGKGETVHQLAAKKAIQELEERRGWIYHAKDADGTLLKTKYDGQFADMAEKEAVRLGVKFQVGGKWCSFVAVEGEEKQQEVDERTLVDDPGEPFNISSGAPASMAARVSGVQKRMKLSGIKSRNSHSMRRSNDHSRLMDSCLAPVTAAPSTGRPLSSSPLPPPLFSPDILAPRPAPTLASYGSARSTDVQSADLSPPMPAEGSSWVAASLFGAPVANATAPPPAPRRAPGGTQADSETRHAPHDYQMPLMMLEQQNKKRLTFSRPDLSSPAAGAHPPPPGRGAFPPASIPPQDPLEFLVNSQTFEGFWADTDALWDVLGVTKYEAIAVMPLSVKAAANIVATLIVIAFLEKKLKVDKDSWELMVQKAEMWVEAQDVWKTVGKSAGEVARDEKVLGIF